MLPGSYNPPPILPYSNTPVGVKSQTDVGADGITISVPRRRSKYFAWACALLGFVLVPSILIIVYLVTVGMRLGGRAADVVVYRAVAPAFCVIISLIWARRLFVKGRCEATVRITASDLQIIEYSGRNRRDFAWKRQDIASISCGRAPGQWTSSLQICSRQGELASLLEGHDEDYLNWLIAAIKHAMQVMRSIVAVPAAPTAPQPTDTPPFDLITPDMGAGTWAYSFWERLR